jgi:nucleotide-binding universal stress UspA family protein
MLKIQTILHPTDFSPNSQCAWEMACALARDYGARLLLLHVEPPLPSFAELGAVSPPPVPMDRPALERQLTQLKPVDSKLAVTRVLLEGNEALEINRFAQENDVDLIVMGTHGRTGLGRFLTGSVAEAVLRKAPCPVLTVRDQAAHRAAPEPQREAAAVT